MIHSNMNKNVNETKWNTLNKFIEKCPDDTSRDIMEDCWDEELDDSKRNHLNEENETDIYDWEGKY